MGNIYPHAPIVEAVLFIKFKKLQGNSVSEFLEFHKQIKEKFPIVQEKLAKSLQIKVDSIDFDNKTEKIGYFFKTEDSPEIFQTDLEGCAFHRLKPYTNWNNFFNEAKYFCSMFLEHFPELNDFKLSLKYINEILVPKTEELSEYINFLPLVPVPWRTKCYKNFFMQVKLPSEDDGQTIILTETMKAPQENKIPLILDIEVTQKITSQIDWQEFDKLRNLKNLIFENCLTSKTKELFK